MGPAAVVITLGSRGCQVIAAETWSVPAPRVEAVDTVGAGDAFNGALAAALADGRDLRQGRRLGQRRRGAGCHPAGCPIGFAVSRAIDQLAAQADGVLLELSWTYSSRREGTCVMAHRPDIASCSVLIALACTHLAWPWASTAARWPATGPPGRRTRLARP